MPKIKIDKVISFSTEDPVHVATNLLSSDPAKKWKCRSPGEKCSSIVLQLEQASIISSVDIGNEHSAYIEVLVSRSGGSDDFKMLLVMSSFMTPLECRQSQNINKVRMFTADQLSKPECEEKWDRIKIVCTQPFNKQVQYGISFITLHSGGAPTAPSAPVRHIGKFALRPDSPVSLSPGSLFARRKESSDESPVTAAAAIRDASLNPGQQTRVKVPLPKKGVRSSTSTNEDDSTPVKNRNRKEILYTEEDDESNEKIDTLVEKKRKQDVERKAAVEVESQKKKKKTDTPTKQSAEKQTPKKEAKREAASKKVNTAKRNDDVAGTSTTPTRVRDLKKRKSDDAEAANKRAKLNKNVKPFGELLSGVTLVISGIQNPERANLRTMALSMGARYKPDWDSTSTHLICAFRNTPKFNQVKGKGQIVTKKWIIDCNSQRKRLPWRRYALDPSDQTGEESEEEISEKNDFPEEDNDPEVFSGNGSDTEDEIERIEAQNKETEETKDRGSDTDEEIQMIQALSDKENSTSIMHNINGNTIDDIENESKYLQLLPKLKSFFDRKHFFIDELLDETIKKMLTQYITAYKGEIVEDLSRNAEIVITSEEGVHELKDKYSGDGHFVVPDWIWECHNKEKLTPMDDFILA